MAKRKHSDDDSDAEIIVEKRPRTEPSRAKSKAKRKRNSQAARAPSDAQPYATSAGPSASAESVATGPSTINPTTQDATISSTGDRSNPISILEAPPGMSKSQRKRWRKKQKLLEAKKSQQARPQQSQPSSLDLTQVATAAQTAKQISKPKSKKSLVQQFAVTQLMPRRQKQWHDAESHKSTKASKGGMEKASKAGVKHQIVSKPDDASDDEEGIKLSRPNHHSPSANKKHQLSVSSHLGSSSSDSEADKEAAAPNEELAAELERSEKIRSTMRARQFSPLTSTGSINVRNDSPVATARRTSFGNKATSIPAVTSDLDPVASFQRFSAWLHKGDSGSEDSDSDSDEAEPELPVAEQVLPPSDGAEELIQHVDATSEHTNSNGGAGTGTAKPTEVTRPMSSDEVGGEQLPRFSDSISQTLLGNGSTWPANVGIKRQMSFLGQELGGDLSGSGVEQDAEPKDLSSTTSVPIDPFEINDDSQELLQTMDEVSNTIFASTRPLPPSKNKRPTHPGNEDQRNRDLTSVSSDRRVTRSMATPKGSQSQIPDDDGGPSDLVDRLGLNKPSFEIPNEPGQNDSPISSDSLSSNIVLGAPGTVSNDEGESKSSSHLSELSRSPSPPVDLGVQSGMESRIFGSAGEASASDIYFTATIDEDDADATPRKKRKQTGTTSKHFTPKKATRKRASKSPGLAAEIHPESLEKSDVQPENEESRDGPSSGGPHKAESEKPGRRTRASSKAEALHTEITQTHNLDDVSAPRSAVHQEEPPPTQEPPPAESTCASTKKRKSTGKTSTYFTPSRPKPALDPNVIDRVDFYNTTASGKKARVPAGTSIAPVPPISAERFGIIQEKLWREPFWLLIAVTFLNKTTGRAAVPVFWELKEKYATPATLAEAKQDELCDMIHRLGLQNQRAKRLISMAKAWVEQGPVKGRRRRILHYPSKDDGKEFKRGEDVKEDADDCAGALEIAHMPGCGAYAYDSWRIFCRDVLRGVAEDYNSAGAEKGFVPEWKKVLPGDKELRACLRWMWLREGWIWDHGSGEKRRATEAEMEKAQQGEMEINDPQERKFAAQAAGIEVSPDKSATDDADDSILKEDEAAAPTPPETNVKRTTRLPAKTARPSTPEPPQPSQPVADEDDSDNIIVSPYVSPVRKRPRKSLRTLSSGT